MVDSSSPFADAAAYYDRYRAPYPPEALDCVVAAFGLGEGDRVLDLGCGPGTLAIPLSRVVGEVVAVDLDANMLAAGRALAADRENIRWIEGRAEDVLTGLGPFRAVTLGQSLHWMDRDLVLALLADVIEDGGGLAIFDGGARRTRESWTDTVQSVVTRYLGRIERHPLKHPEKDHAPCLRRSTHFSDFTIVEFTSQITRDAASILGCVYTDVGATRPMFGDRAAAFEAELARELARLNPTGVFHEAIDTAVYLAPKAVRAG